MKTTRRTADEVLSFLAAQRLEPTPQNYAMGYHYVAGTNPVVAKAVETFAQDGIRISQEEADQIMLVSISSAHVAPPTEGDDPREAARHHLLRIAEIASSQTDATSRLGRDLSDGMNKLGDGSDGIGAIVRKMIERTQDAERDLKAAATEMEKLRQELETARSDATLDALTGISNRRAVDQHLAELESQGKARVIAFCDVDRFKRINDEYGHAVGDRVLKGVANTLTSECSAHAFVGRWGGEEFVLVFEGDDVEGVKAIVDAARETLCARQFKLRENDQPLGMVSFSAGIATGCGPNSEIVAHADSLLYRAKEEGRNKVIA